MATKVFTTKHRRSGVVLAALAVMLVGAGCVTGAVPGVPPADPGLTAHNYVQQDYFLDGVAHAYAPVGPIGSDGHWNVRTTTTAQYRTRLQVRRPADAARFNGTVLVEWLNVSSGS